MLLMAREVGVGYYAGARYRVWPNDSVQATLGRHVVRLVDDVPSAKDPSARVRADVAIVVDGRPVSIARNVTVRPFWLESGRYNHDLALVRFEDAFQKTSALAVVQNLGVDPSRPRLPNGGYDFDFLRFRMIRLDQDGQLHEEIFFRKDRGHPPLRAEVARFASPSPMGYYSDLMQVWPSIFYPLVYPWGTTALGLLVLAIGTKRRSSVSRASAQ
jgi:hypothetical protein